MRLMFELARGRRAIPPASVTRRGGIETGVEAEPVPREALRWTQLFTLPEIMPVVGLIGLLAAVNGWASAVGAAEGVFVDLTTTGQPTQPGIPNTADLLENPHGIDFVGSNQVAVSIATKPTLPVASIDREPY